MALCLLHPNCCSQAPPPRLSPIPPPPGEGLLFWDWSLGFCSDQGGWGKSWGQQGFIQLCLVPTPLKDLLKMRWWGGVGWGRLGEEEHREPGELWEEASSIAIPAISLVLPFFLFSIS